MKEESRFGVTEPSNFGVSMKEESSFGDMALAEDKRESESGIAVEDDAEERADREGETGCKQIKKKI